MVEEVEQFRKMQLTSWLYLLVICVGSYIFASWSFAWATFAGGVISILSFQVAHKDVLGFVETVKDTTDGLEEEQQKKVVKQNKLGFLLRFWVRIIIIGVILLVLIKYGKLEKESIFGLILGLSTVVFTIAFTALNVVRHYYTRRR